MSCHRWVCSFYFGRTHLKFLSKEVYLKKLGFSCLRPQSPTHFVMAFVFQAEQTWIFSQQAMPLEERQGQRFPAHHTIVPLCVFKPDIRFTWNLKCTAWGPDGGHEQGNIKKCHKLSTPFFVLCILNHAWGMLAWFTKSGLSRMPRIWSAKHASMYLNNL